MTVCVGAVSVGCAVPRPHFATIVHSVFRNAINLRGPGESLLLTLLLSGASDLPQGIRLEAANCVAFEDLQIGTPAVCTNDLLVLGKEFMVDLRPGHRWECDLYSLAADLSDPVVVRAWRKAWQTLQVRQDAPRPPEFAVTQLGQADSAASWCNQRVEAAVRRLLEATAGYDLGGMSAIRDMIGAGPGLTPFGDDLLMGYLAGMWCTARREPMRGDFLWAVAELVIRMAARTNDVARTYLSLAARGQVSGLLLDLAATIAQGDCDELVRMRAEAAMRVGHTSGKAAVNGLLLGLAAWDGPGLLETMPDCLAA